MEQLIYRGLVVATGAMLADQLGTTTAVISDNFNYNKERYQEGVHYFLLKGSELKSFKSCIGNSDIVNLHSENFRLQISSKTRSLYLWTEKGAFNQVKSLGTDEAWDSFKKLVDTYFVVRDIADQLTQVTEPEYKLPTSFPEALRLLADETERSMRKDVVIKEISSENSLLTAQNEAKEAIIDWMGPHALVGQQLTSGSQTVEIMKFAKSIGEKPLKFFEKLRSDGFLMSSPGHWNEPYQKFLEKGWFDYKPEIIKSGAKEGERYYQTRVTPAGQRELINFYRGKKNESALLGTQLTINASRPW